MKTSNVLNKLFEAMMTPAEMSANRQLGLISAAIELWRADHNMTQAAFAEFMGVTQAMVSKWESGEYNFTVKVLAEISTKLEMPLETLFSGNLEPYNYEKSSVMSSKTKVEAPGESTTFKPFYPCKFEILPGGAA